MTAVARLEGVSKSFGQVCALDDVSYEIPHGEIVALLGPNGAGKTTSLSLLLGLRRPDRGTAQLFGHDPTRPATRRRLGTTPQEMAFPGTLRVDEVVDLVRAHYAEPPSTESLLGRFELGALGRRQTGGLSGGERRRLAVALAFAGAPELVVLDEPTTGLDVEARGAVWQELRLFVSSGGTVLLTTHYLEEAEALATKVVVIDRGRVAAAGSVDEIRARAGAGRISFRREPLPSNLAGDVSEDGDRVVIHASHPEEVVRQLVHTGARLQDLDVRPLPLEEALRLLPGGS
jgi:ABC-2 type transport system ATP-binding protein